MKIIESNNTSLGKRLGAALKKLMALHKINMTQLNKSTDVPLTTLNRILSGKNINPTITSLLPLAEFFNITLNQLMGIDPLNLDASSNIPIKKTDAWIYIPLINWEQALEWPKNNLDKTAFDSISTDIDLSANAFALRIEELNWEGFFSGSILITDPDIKPEHSDYVVTVKKGQAKASLKQILIDDGCKYLRPLNKEYQTQVMDSSYSIVGTVAQIRMNRK